MDKELIFESRELFREWLEKHGQTNGGIWLIFGKTTILKTLSAHEALEEALCFGWIDGLIVSIDKDTYRKYFARRIKRSKWSVKNKKLVEKLINEGKMTNAGIEAVNEARKNGKWDNVQDKNISDSQKTDFESKIQDCTLAYRNYCTLSQSMQKQFIGFYLEAKKEDTRQKRLEKIITLLEQNKRLM